MQRILDEVLALKRIGSILVSSGKEFIVGETKVAGRRFMTGCIYSLMKCIFFAA
jgi:hypothetical protein